MIKAYIALGSNLENPGLQLQRAVDEIDSAADVHVTGLFSPLSERSSGGPECSGRPARLL